MRRKMLIADCLYLGQDADHYWLEAQMPDGSAAAIALNQLNGFIVPKVFVAWAKQTLKKLEDGFVEQVSKQFEGETDAEDYGAEEDNQESTSSEGDSSKTS